MPDAPATVDAPPSAATAQGSAANERHFSGGTDPLPGGDNQNDSELFAGLTAHTGEPKAFTSPESEKFDPRNEPKPDAEKEKPAKTTDEDKGKEKAKPDGKAKAEADDDADDDFLNPKQDAKKADEDDDTEIVDLKAKKDATATEDPKADTKPSGVKTLRTELEKRKTEVTTLAKSVESKDKEIAELRTQLSMHDYTKSQEYIEKYDRPIHSAVEYAAKELQGISVIDSDGTSRPVDYARDFAPLLSKTIPRDQIVRMVNEKFGDYAPEVLGMRRDILKAVERRSEAAETFRSRADEIRAEQQQQAIKARELVKSKFGELREEMKSGERVKSLFSAGNDARHQRLLEDGEALVQRVFEPTLGTPQDIILRDQAAAANRIVVAGVLQRKVRQLEQQIAQLEKYRNSTPGSGDGVDRNGAGSEDPFEAIHKYATAR